MRVISNFHPPSSVCCSVKCRFTPDLEFLVIGYPNRVEVHSITTEGLTYECSTQIWGQLVAIKPLCRQGSPVEKLLLLTDHPYPKVTLLSLSLPETGAPTLLEDGVVDLEEPGAQPSEFLTDIVVNVSATVAVAMCYARRLKVILLEDHLLGDSFDVSLSQTNIISIAFLPNLSTALTLSILHLNSEQVPELSFRELDLDERELSPSPSIHLQDVLLPAHSVTAGDNKPTLVPIPNSDSFSGGLVVLGRKEIYLFNAFQSKGKAKSHDTEIVSKDRGTAKHGEGGKVKQPKRRKAKATLAWPWGEIVAWCSIDGSRYLLGDKIGRLVLLEIQQSALTVLLLGESNTTTSLAYLSSQVVYLGSFLHDSQLLRIHPMPIKRLESTNPLDSRFPSPGKLDEIRKNERRDGKALILSSDNSYLEVLETFPNIAPISDAILFDPNNTGQHQILTCSGSGRHGSLKIVSSGASFSESAVIPLPGAMAIFPIKDTYLSNLHTYLVVSTLRETHMFRISSDSVVHLDLDAAIGLAHKTKTIAMSNISKRVPKSAGKPVTTYVDSSFVVQVTSQDVRLLHLNPSSDVPVLNRDPWSPNQVSGWADREIFSASINASQVVLALSGGILVVLNVDESDQLRMHSFKNFGDEISAVSCQPSNPAQFFSSIVAVGFWGSNEVHLLKIGSSTPFQTIGTTGPLSALPRSLLLHNFGTSHDVRHPNYKPHLLVGLADGTMVTFFYDEPKKTLEMKTSVSLGNSAVHLAPYNINDRPSVFACSSRAELIYWETQRLRRSPILLQDTECAALFNTASAGSALVLSTRGRILVGRIRDLNQVHIRSIPTGRDIPQNVFIVPNPGAFAVSFNHGSVESDDRVKGKLRLYDQTSFDILAEFTCEPGEEISASQLLPLQSADVTYLCLGTVVTLDYEIEPSKGRLIFLKLEIENESGQRRVSQVQEISLPGCVYALSTVKDMLAVAVNSSVHLYKFTTNPNFLAEEVDSWDQNYTATNLTSNGDDLVVGDVLHSISILEIKDGRLAIKSRDYSTLWPFRLESINKDGVVVCNVDRNLSTFRTVTTGNKTALELDGSYNLHELITKFIPGSFSQTEANAVLTPQQTFFTSGGGIGVISELNPDLALDMTALQSNMEKIIHGVGISDHTKLRSTKGRYTSQPGVGFLDGQFLEQFLRLDAETRHRIVQGSNEAEKLKLSEAQIDQILEGFQRVH